VNSDRRKAAEGEPWCGAARPHRTQAGERGAEGAPLSDVGDDQPIKVVVVDDHLLVRSGLRTVLAIFDDIRVVAEAKSGAEAVAVCRRERPDVVLMDLVMPDMNGVEATERVLEVCPGIRVVALTSFTDESLVEGSLRAGAIGYLMKNVSADELAEAIRAAHAGRSTLAPEAAGVLVRAVSAPREPVDALSQREREVLRLMADGLTNAAIADRLVIGVSTVKTHVSSIIAKLGVSTRTEACSVAIRRGLV
jgi:two-component system, NarL family, response regulator LiaR